MDNDIIQDFIDETPEWVEQLGNMEEISGEKMCPTCGVKPKKIMELVEAIKKLREKAWKYDKLCK